MKRIKSLIPLSFLVLSISILSFGLLIPWLGFYWDDWLIILTLRLQGLRAFWDYFQIDRPLAAWVSMFFGAIFGANQLAWQLAALAARWLTVMGFWWVLRLLWPDRKHEAASATFLYAVYPAFTLQPIAVIFSQIWLCGALFFLSLALMLEATRRSRWLLTALAVVLLVLHSGWDYFVSLELLRPLLLWISFSRIPTKLRFRKTMTAWLPYLLTLVALLVWRLYLLQAGQIMRNQPVLAYNLMRQPLDSLIQVFQFALQDIVMNLGAVWNKTLEPAAIVLHDKLFLESFGIGLLCAGLVSYFLENMNRQNPPAQVAEVDGWHRQALGIGLAITVLGPLPIWLTGRQALEGLYGSRYVLAALPGLSLLVVGLLGWLTPRRFPKVIVVGLLVGLAASYHFRSTQPFVQSWAKQNQFYWQLFWRAPVLKPGTSILSTDELFMYVGRYNTAMALNLLYPQPAGSRSLAYWFVELPYNVGEAGSAQYIEGEQVDYSARIYSFHGDSRDSLAIFYQPDFGRCLWVLSSKDQFNPEIPAFTRRVLSLSKLERILPGTSPAGYPDREIFGSEPAHLWCYYYQKADFARQLGDWSMVTRLFDEAWSKGYKPSNSHEWEPFIEGFAHQGRWDEAINRTRKAYEKDPRYSAQLCYLWLLIQRDTPVPGETWPKISKLQEDLKCSEIPESP